MALRKEWQYRGPGRPPGPKKKTKEELEASAEYMRNYRARHNSPVVKQADIWKAAFDKLSPEERAALREQESEACYLNTAMQSATMIEKYAPDIFLDACSFREQFPMVRNWVPESWIDDDELFSCVDLAASDDEHFRLYGLRTRVVFMFWINFLDHLVRWAETHECNPEILAEAQRELTAHRIAIDGPSVTTPQIKPDDGRPIVIANPKVVQEQLEKEHRLLAEHNRQWSPL